MINNVVRVSENKFHNVCFILQQLIPKECVSHTAISKTQEEGKVKKLQNQDPFANTPVRFKMAVSLFSVVSGRHFLSYSVLTFHNFKFFVIHVCCTGSQEKASYPSTIQQI